MPLLPRRKKLTPSNPVSELHPIKLRAIDAAFERVRPRSAADLGGVWAVDAGYTFYMLDRYQLDRAVLVDESPTEVVVDRATDYPALSLLRANFGSREVASTVGAIDLVLLFDVLLHQVAPNWDELLELYSATTETFVIVNPQYVAGTRTTRLLDLGRDRYESIVPVQPGYEDLFDRLDEFLPERNRNYRDIHNVWQWGITDDDLRSAMERLGYALVYFENAGQWRDQPAFENHAFIFSRLQRGQTGL